MPVDWVLKPLPNPSEARQFVDDWRHFRTGHLREIRRYVAAAFPWPDHMSPEGVTSLAKRLLNGHAFVCVHDHRQSMISHDFAIDCVTAGDCISDVLLITLWSPGIGGCVRPFTAHMFTPIPDEIILWASMMLTHCIKEWEGGKYRQSPLTEQNGHAIFVALHASWLALGHERNDQYKKFVIERIEQSITDRRVVPGRTTLGQTRIRKMPTRRKRTTRDSGCQTSD